MRLSKATRINSTYTRDHLHPSYVATGVAPAAAVHSVRLATSIIPPEHKKSRSVGGCCGKNCFYHGVASCSLSKAKLNDTLIP